MEITRGIPQKAIRCVIYGPEGIGKSTFAALWPNPVFIDTEDSTAFMDVDRYPKPSSWTMLLEEVKDTGKHPEIRTLVLDTADWAERLCKEHICAKNNVDSIEAFGYGKGYTYLAEEWGRLLDELTALRNQGINTVVTAHAMMRKFEQPDEMGAYDRWELKLEKKTAPMTKEWADLVLFASYETVTVKTKEGKVKGQGGKRVLYTTHHVCWDAKNRQGLPEKVDFDRENCLQMIAYLTKDVNATAKPAGEAHNAAVPREDEPKGRNTTPSQGTVEALAGAEETDAQQAGLPFDDPYNGIPPGLADLMRKDNITPEALAEAQFKKWGYFPEGMLPKEWPEDFCEYLTTVWAPLISYIKENEINGLPF